MTKRFFTALGFIVLITASSCGGGGGSGSRLSSQSDRDGDGIIDELDAFPDNPNESVDTDNDGTGDNGDCDDAHADISPNATDTCGDGVDQDCSGADLLCDISPPPPAEPLDRDDDGYTTTTDCNDDDATIHPDAVEGIADGIDQNCDARELCYLDNDSDGVRPDGGATISSTDLICTGAREASLTTPAGDCNDANATIHPGATEICNDGVDQNCDDLPTPCGLYGALTTDSADLSFFGTRAGAEAGYALAIADNLNGDAFPDLIIGAPFDILGGIDSGTTFILYSPFTGNDVVLLDPTLLPHFIGESGDLSGSAIAALHDLYGNGRDDLAIGAPQALDTLQANDTFPGGVYVVDGTSSAFSGAKSLADNAFAIFGEMDGDLLGTAITSGDIAGDTGTDLVIGAIGYDGDSIEIGASYVISEAPIDSVTLSPDPTTFRLSGDVNEDGIESYSGIALDASGDWNDDGEDDLIIAASNYAGAGTVYLLDGPITATRALSNADVQILGTATGDDFGWSLAVGDLNDDGVSDLAIGAPRANRNGKADTGAVYLFYGPITTDLTLADADFILDGVLSKDYAGTSIAIADDINGEGLNDLLIGAPGKDTNTSTKDSGALYLVYGETLRDTTSPTISLVNADAIFSGTHAGDMLGSAIATDDLDRDGFSDVVVSAPKLDHDAMLDAGSVFIWFGGSI